MTDSTTIQLISKTGEIVDTISEVGTSKKRKRVNQTSESTTKVIEVLDPKTEKEKIRTHWQAYTPQQIVKAMRKLYDKTSTLSVQLSNMKRVYESYQMVTAEGETFDAEIATFELSQPYLVN